MCSINYYNDAARPQALAAAGLGTAMGHLHTVSTLSTPVTRVLHCSLLIPGRYILVSLFIQTQRVAAAGHTDTPLLSVPIS